MTHKKRPKKWGFAALPLAERQAFARSIKGANADLAAILAAGGVRLRKRGRR